MSPARCCCSVGPYTQAVRCSCTAGTDDPAFITNYDAALGCVYFQDLGGVCWYVGPESPSKDTLDAGDVDLGSQTLVQVESADLACCLCCECGGSNGSPLACFDTPAGGCECCPEDGDGTEWIWTWQTSWQIGHPRVSRHLISSGTMHYKDAGASNCARVLSIDGSTDLWAYDLSGALDCERHETLDDCADLYTFFYQDPRWGTAPCGDRIVPSGWDVPRMAWGGDPSCLNLGMVYEDGFDPFNVNHWTGTSGCTWTGTSYTWGSQRFDTSGAIFFSGDCHHSRVVWNFTVSVYSLPSETKVNELVAAGSLDLQVVAPACPGGCGHRARFFGHNAIPAEAGGGVGLAMVPRSLGGLLA